MIIYFTESFRIRRYTNLQLIKLVYRYYFDHPAMLTLTFRQTCQMRGSPRILEENKKRVTKALVNYQNVGENPTINSTFKVLVSHHGAVHG